jgi:hypothetical protein
VELFATRTDSNGCIFYLELYCRGNWERSEVPMRVVMTKNHIAYLYILTLTLYCVQLGELYRWVNRFLRIIYCAIWTIRVINSTCLCTSSNLFICLGFRITSIYSMRYWCMLSLISFLLVFRLDYWTCNVDNLARRTFCASKRRHSLLFLLFIYGILNAGLCYRSSSLW